MAPLAAPVPPALWRRTGQTLEVRDFGAVGDGRTDDTEAVVRAVSAAVPGDTVRFADGTYLLDAVDLGRHGSPALTLEGGPRALIRKHPAGRFDATNGGHVFFDASSDGGSDGLRIRDLRFDLSRGAARPGDTVSALFLSRVRGLEVSGCTFSGGIEEGLKLYKCQDVRITDCLFERIRNNGVQIHAPPSGADGYTGARPNQGWRNVQVRRCTFREIDDGMGGAMEGQGVTFNSTDPEVECASGQVVDCDFEGCVRGIWAEVNHAGVVVRDLAFSLNRVSMSVAIGAGVVGVEDAVISDNEIRDTVATTVASDALAGIVVSGSAAPRPRSMRVRVERNRVVDDRGGGALMRHGILVRNAEDVTLEGNEVRGATVEPIRIEGSAARVRIG